MTEKQFTYIKLGDRDEIQDYIINNNHNSYFKNKEYHFNNISDFEDLFDLLNELSTENKQLKQRINSRLHFYRELYEETNDNVVKRVIEDLEDILK